MQKYLLPLDLYRSMGHLKISRHTEEVVPSVTSQAHPSDVIPILAASSNTCLDLLLREISKTTLTPAKERFNLNKFIPNYKNSL